ncbi:hypothetical protein GZH46_01649 [Fragariocoptes setiger]|uniref:GTP-binding protein n=1 Tax=Fragariocoptes setiger TaxID=1670756 RepID=A0ABQ7S8T2_9ACAR|nr:hypothetical protein GZH46_01649 [Fragariocoptes setiger]
MSSRSSSSTSASSTSLTGAYDDDDIVRLDWINDTELRHFTCVVVGSQGSGKTTLIEHFFAQLEAFHADQQRADADKIISALRSCADSVQKSENYSRHRQRRQRHRHHHRHHHHNHNTIIGAGQDNRLIDSGATNSTNTCVRVSSDNDNNNNNNNTNSNSNNNNQSQSEATKRRSILSWSPIKGALHRPFKRHSTAATGVHSTLIESTLPFFLGPMSSMTATSDTDPTVTAITMGSSLSAQQRLRTASLFVTPSTGYTNSEAYDTKLQPSSTTSNALPDGNTLLRAPTLMDAVNCPNKHVNLTVTGASAQNTLPSHVNDVQQQQQPRRSEHSVDGRAYSPSKPLHLSFREIRSIKKQVVLPKRAATTSGASNYPGGVFSASTGDNPSPYKQQQASSSYVCKRRPDAYVIVFAVNERESFECAESLMKQIHDIGDIQDQPVILVANKTDLVRNRVITRRGQPATKKPSFIKRLFRRASLTKSRSCDDFHVL